MKDILTNILNSFNNLSIGYSGKKLTAFLITIVCLCTPTITWCVWAYNHNDWSMLIGILSIFSGLIGGLFAINVADKFKNPTDKGDS